MYTQELLLLMNGENRNPNLIYACVDRDLQ